MKSNFYNRIGALALLGVTTINSHANSQILKIVSKKIKNGNITSFSAQIGENIKQIELPKGGAKINSFSARIDKWNNEDILAATLDERGQVPIIAYFSLFNSKACYIGKYALLSFDKESSYVVEPQYSSASDQLINRYKYSHCKLTPYDQLLDTAISLNSSELVRRKVTRGKRGEITVL